jgi:hypothetical protein
MNAHRDELRPSARNWLVLALGAGGGTILIVLLARTAVGAIDRQLGPLTIAGLAAAGFALAMTVWRLDDASRPLDAWQQRTVRAAAALLAGLLFGLLVARDSSAGIVSVAVMTLTWAVAAAVRIRPAIGAEFFAARLSSTKTEPNALPTACTSSSNSADSVELEQSALAMTSPRVPDENDDDPSLQLQLRRCRTEEGESIEIQARLEFAAGAREAVLHVPFWPALSASPVVECEPLDADDIELRVTSAEPYGLRLEGRLPSITAVPRSVLIGVEVQVATGATGIVVAA